MSTMVLEVYDALKEAGASEASARRAAEAVLQGDSARLDGIDQRLDRLEKDFSGMRQDIGGLRREIDQFGGRVATLTWMGGLTISLVLLMLGKLFLTH